MGSSQESTTTYINCGEYKFMSEKLNDRSTIDEIHGEIRQLCGHHLTHPYYLMFYHSQKRKLIKLNQNYLTDEFNLFRMPSGQDAVGPHFIELYVINISDDFETQISSVDVKESVSEQDVPVDKSGTTGELSKALLPNEHMDNNYSTDDEESISEKTENRHPTINFPLSDQDQTSRVYFSLDVKPEQKPIYKSDQFNQKDRTKTNGYVTCIQGIKSDQQKRSSIRPRVHIPDIYRGKNNIKLVVYVVFEELDQGKRFLYKHNDKGFLPENFNQQTKPLNPIEFDINTQTLWPNGDMELDLRMTTLWDKVNRPKFICSLDEEFVMQLHKANHDPSSPRLLCIIKQEQKNILKTIGLSDFIRKKNSSKRTSASSPTSIEQTGCKRVKIN